MGGFGSGGSRYQGRFTTSEACELSVAYLLRCGALARGGRSGISSWSARDKQVASIGWRTELAGAPRLYLSYTYTRSGEAPRNVEESFHLATTQPHFGGVRWWIRCACWRRAGKLFMPRGGHLFRCRHCYRLSYASRNETPEWRAYRRLQKCDGRLDPALAKRRVPADYLDGYTPPSKPKGMRWWKYDQIVSEAEHHAARYRSLSLKNFSKLFGGQFRDFW